jgi:hypothetical protein
MCNRESFVLFPKETGIPVAWTVSYHHEDILMAARVSKQFNWQRMELGHDNFVQIECTDGDVHKWDWDNTPYKNANAAYLNQWYPNKYLEEYRYERDIPRWLEDDLRFYENWTEKILEKLNPVRDAEEKLREDLAEIQYGKTQSKYMIAKPDTLGMIRHLPSESPAVKEFERIINAYRDMPGFLEESPIEVGSEDYYNNLLNLSARQIAAAYGIPSQVIYCPTTPVKYTPSKPFITFP